MKRREFVGLACGASVLAATTSRAAWAVEPHKMYRLAIVHPSHPVSDLTVGLTLSEPLLARADEVIE